MASYLTVNTRMPLGAHRHIELVGLIGAGKSSLAFSLANYHRSRRLGYMGLCVSIESEEHLDRFVNPLLAKVYLEEEAGVALSAEATIEAIFAIYRLAEMHRLLQQNFPSHDLTQARDVACEYITHLFSRIKLEEYTPSAEAIKGDFIAWARRNASYAPWDDTAASLMDRGPVDVLVFTLERLGTITAEERKKPFRRLFMIILQETCDLLLHRPSHLGPQQVKRNFLDGWTPRFTYSVALLDMDQATCGKRAKGRARPSEVDSSTGELQPRVLAVNAGLEKIYRSFLLPRPFESLHNDLLDFLADSDQENRLPYFTPLISALKTLWERFDFAALPEDEKSSLRELAEQRGGIHSVFYSVI